MAELLTVPYLGTAETEVVVADWLVGEGEAFHKGQALLVLETLKASFEVEAEADGVLLQQLQSAGQRVPVDAALAVWGEDAAALDAGELEALLAEHDAATPGGAATSAPETSPVEVPERPRVPAAPAARRRALELGVELAAIAGTGPGGMVRVDDVEAAAAPAASPGAVSDGRVDARFLEHVRADRDAFGRLSSEFKVALYRRHGAVLGDDVTIGDGTVLLAERLVLGDGVRFGAGCRIEAVELVAGALTAFGPRCTVRCRRVQLGENAFLTSDIEIGGGGAMDPEAELVVGSHGFVGEHVHLNPCRPLVIGDEVVISRNAVIMTHSFGASVLAGYPNRFAGVSIGDGCQVGIGAVLFPGVTMGEGSILLSGSSLVTSVPAGRLFGGVPAEDLKAAAQELGEARLLALAQGLVEEFARQLELRGFAIRVSADGDERQLTVDHGGRRHRLHFAPELPGRDHGRYAEDVRVCVGAGDADWAALGPEIVGIDLSAPRIRGAAGPLAGAFREFLRKRGVRLEPRTWTYRGGWL